VPAAAAAAPGAAAALAAAPTDVTFGPIIQQLHALDGLQRNKEKAHAEQLAAKDKELKAQHSELAQARLVVAAANAKSLERKKLAEHLVICMLLCCLLLLVRCLSSVRSLQQFMQATQMQLQHQKHMQMQDTLIRESQEIVQDMHACKEMATAITTAITTANTQLEQVHKELKEAKQQITIMQEKVDKANKQVAAKNASIEMEVLYHIRPALY